MEMVSADFPRRTANYKPNIWNYDHIQSLTTKFDEEEYEREAEQLREEVWRVVEGLKDPLQKLEVMDWINKLALSHYFQEEMRECLNNVACNNGGLYSTALYPRILRQNGYHVSQDSMVEMSDEEEMRGSDKTMIEIFEASDLGLQSEMTYLRKCPLQRRSVTWFNAKKRIHSMGEHSTLRRLAGLSFNMVQLQHQKDLKEILRWWRDLELSEVLAFTRDRVVESFLWAVGVAHEPQYGSLRKWLTKAILLVLIIDDVYDIYGSIHEVEQFTTAVERWDPSEIEELPEVISRCFWILYDTTHNIDLEVQKEKGCNSVLPHLKKVWAGFCKALLVEAEWYHRGHSPSLGEYLENGWISASGTVLSLHILLGISQDIAETMDAFRSNQEIIRQASLIIRLSNDQGTSKAELERGDAPTSILCYMREADATEEEARGHVRKLVSDSWKKMNGLFMESNEQEMMRYVVNTARVANFIYQNGDGFGVQDGETRSQVLSCLIEPLPLA